MQDKNQVGIVRRGFAWILDWYLCGLLASLIIGMIWINIADTNVLQADLSLMPGNFGYIAGLIGITVCVFYYLVIPFCIWKGQTPAKKLLNIKIVNEKDEDASFLELFLRQFVALFFVDAYFTASTTLVIQVLGLMLAPGFVKIIDYYFMAMTIISVALVLVSPKHKAIHDLLAKTKIVSIEKI